MAWNTVLPLMVRHLVGDLGSTEAYTDERLATAVTIAAILVQQEYDFDTSYTVDIEAPCLEPDPTDSATLDYQACALFTLKAACIVMGGSYHSAVKGGVKITDWNSSIDTTGKITGYKDIIASGPCKAYSDLVNAMYLENRSGMGKAVLSPYSTGTDSSYISPNGIWYARGFFDYLLR